MKYLRIIIIGLILLSVAAFFWFTAGSDPEVLLLDSLSSAARHPLRVVLLLSLFILLSTLTGLPILYINLALGFTLSFLPAMLISWSVNLLSVMAAFYMVRFLFSNYFREKYGKKKLIKGFNKQIGKYGMWSVAFSRAIYIIPTAVINFSFPLSKIKARSYLLGNVLGLLPECLVGVLSGYLIKHGITLLSHTETEKWQILAIGGFLLLAVLLIILLIMRRRQRKNY